MTPSEKAIEIYNRFAKVSPLYIEEKRKQSIKSQCMMHVELVIEELELINNFSKSTVAYRPFWIANGLEFYNLVKIELQNL